MKSISQKELSEIKEKYKVRTRVRLVSMDDVQAPPIGTIGTVVGVDAVGTIHVDWDNGCGLGVIPGVDVIEIVPALENKLEGENR